MNALLFTVTILVVQQSALPVATVTGDTVSISADVAWITSGPPGVSIRRDITVVKGTILAGDAFLLASYDGKLPVSWRLPPGAYKITALGYPPNRFLPLRSKAILDVVIVSATRQQEIRDALQKLTESKFNRGEGERVLDLLKPTKAELRAAALPLQ